MLEGTIVINQYTDSLTGHTNVSFYGPDGTFLGTFGGNIRDADFNPFNGLEGGVYNETDPSRIPNHTSTVVLSDGQFWAAYDHAINQVNSTDSDYFLIGQNCVDFVDGVLNAAGQGFTAGMHYVAGTMIDIYADIANFFRNEWSDHVNNWGGLYGEGSFGFNGFGDFFNAAAKLGGSILDKIVKEFEAHFRENSYASSIVLDLDGNGIETTSISDNGITFDIDGDGDLDSTGWINPNDAFLVFDEDQNGLINSVNEMFGGLERGQGYEKLSRFDSNKNGLIDTNDDAFNSLMLWTDLNSNAVTDVGELIYLRDSQVSNISLDYESVEIKFGDNIAGEISDGYMRDGAEFLVADIYFRYSEIV